MQQNPPGCCLLCLGHHTATAYKPHRGHDQSGTFLDQPQWSRCHTVAKKHLLHVPKRMCPQVWRTHSTKAW